jgi:hypothetical protein
MHYRGGNGLQFEVRLPTKVIQAAIPEGRVGVNVVVFRDDVITGTPMDLDDSGLACSKSPHQLTNLLWKLIEWLK